MIVEYLSAILTTCYWDRWRPCWQQAHMLRILCCMPTPSIAIVWQLLLYLRQHWKTGHVKQKCSTLIFLTCVQIHWLLKRFFPRLTRYAEFTFSNLFCEFSCRWTDLSVFLTKFWYLSWWVYTTTVSVVDDCSLLSLVLFLSDKEG
jgi:hypothetical protein